MRLRLLGTESGHNGCPALYATDRDTYVVQGKRVFDEEAVADLVDVRDDEFYVEIPKALLRYARMTRDRLCGPGVRSSAGTSTRPSGWKRDTGTTTRRGRAAAPVHGRRVDQTGMRTGRSCSAAGRRRESG